MSYILRNADFVQTSLRNAVLDKRPSDPEHAVEGQIMFNTTDKEAKLYKNDAWQPFGGGGGAPIGSIFMWLAAAIPDGYLKLDGSVVNIADYPDLFALWGTTYGGNGTTTFGIPDWREYSPVGMSAAAPYNALNAAIGAKTSTGLIAHTHAIDHDHASVTSGAGGSHTHAIDHDHASVTSGSGGVAHTHAIDHNHAAVTSGAGSSHNHAFTGNATGSNSADHTHSFTTGNPSANHTHSVSGSTETDGAHTHTSKYYNTGSFSSDGLRWLRPSDQSSYSGITNAMESGGSHSHSISLTSGTVSAWHTHSGTTGNNSAGHTHTTSGSIAAEAAHTHSVDLPSFSGTSGAASATSHTHAVDIGAYTGASGAEAAHTHAVNLPSFSGSSGSAGSGTSFSILDPKRVCHFIVRGR